MVFAALVPRPRLVVTAPIFKSRLRAFNLLFSSCSSVILFCASQSACKLTVIKYQWGNIKNASPCITFVSPSFLEASLVLKHQGSLQKPQTVMKTPFYAQDLLTRYDVFKYLTNSSRRQNPIHSHL